jgi:hypothetical protein
MIRQRISFLALTGLLLASAPLLAACEEEQGPMEQMGESADEAINQAADDLEDAADKVEEKVEEQTN